MKQFLFITFVFAIISFNVKGQDEKLQTTYIYNIVKNVDWPESYYTGDFVIGILGSGPITDELKKMASTKKVFSQKISIVEFNSPEEITKCHVLFITKLKANSIKDVVAKIGANATLIIGETPGLASYGASINFIKQDGKLVFQINESTANKQGLKISSNLKELALF